jgi:uncharacterized membrane protein YdjX (TVP38/TMEM64 family)
MDPQSVIKTKAKGRFYFSLILLLAILFVPFILLKPHGWTDLDYWQSLMDPISHQSLKAFCIIGLMASDLFLPIPSIPLLLWSGNQLGVALGALINLLSLTLAHTIAYELCRLGGMKAYQKFIGKELHRSASELFQNYGPPALVLSRNLPILSEVFSALAGLSGMKRKLFQTSIFVSNLPTALTLSWLGHQDSSELMLTGSISLMVLPLFILLMIRSKLASGLKNEPTEVQEGTSGRS